MRYKLGPVIRLKDAPKDGTLVVAHVGLSQVSATWDDNLKRWYLWNGRRGGRKKVFPDNTPCQVIEEDA